MSVVWKFSAPSTGTLTDVAILGVDALILTMVNQGIDTLTFDDVATEFDAALRWALDTEIVLSRTLDSDPAVTWFRGTVRDTERIGTGAEMRIRYTVHGPWQWLERCPYLQFFKVPSNPLNPVSTLVNQARGRVVLGQKGDGTKLYLGDILGDIVGRAITAGAPIAFAGYTLALNVPWEEATDLSCAEALQRVLRWRSDLAPITLAVQPAGTADSAAYAPLESVRLRTRPDLMVASVILLYLATNRANEAVWETISFDNYPAGITEGAPDQLLRTIRLAGSVFNASVLTQQVEIDPIPSQLALSGPVTTGGDFVILREWWRMHAQQLRASNIIPKAFYSGARQLEDGTVVTVTTVNELTKGAVTDWMIAKQGVVAERQRVTVICEYDVSDAVTGKLEHMVSQLATTILATNAQTKTYSFSASSTWTPAEAIPTGLAQALYTAFATLQHEGSVVLLEPDCSYATTVGKALQLTGSLAAWSTMLAIIQSAEMDLQNGRTVFTVGPAKHLGIADLVDVFRNNRTNPPVTSSFTRTTGSSLSPDSQQGLSLHHPSPRVAGDQHIGPQVLTNGITVAGVVPTSTEIATALAGAYTGANVPRTGDSVLLSVSGVLKFRARVTSTNPGTGGIFAVSFTVSSVTYYAVLNQVGIY
jgi:hypothetical protein